LSLLHKTSINIIIISPINVLPNMSVHIYKNELFTYHVNPIVQFENGKAIAKF
jgi:hypothetical protein